jgi:hypothetical protein
LSVTIALAVLLVAALVGAIRYDMRHTAAPQPMTRAGMNSAPLRGTQLPRLSGCADAVAPSSAVIHLLGRIARFQLAQRVADRSEGNRDE